MVLEERPRTLSIHKFKELSGNANTYREDKPQTHCSKKYLPQKQRQWKTSKCVEERTREQQCPYPPRGERGRGEDRTLYPVKMSLIKEQWGTVTHTFKPSSCQGRWISITPAWSTHPVPGPQGYITFLKYIYIFKQIKKQKICY